MRTKYWGSLEIRRVTRSRLLEDTQCARDQYSGRGSQGDNLHGTTAGNDTERGGMFST